MPLVTILRGCLMANLLLIAQRAYKAVGFCLCGLCSVERWLEGIALISRWGVGLFFRSPHGVALLSVAA